MHHAGDGFVAQEPREGVGLQQIELGQAGLGMDGRTMPRAELSSTTTWWPLWIS